jgi:hypothetical protein
MMQSEAHVKTAMAARYLAQLCKHFAHKLAVSHDGNSGRIEFASGVCILQAQDDVLILRAQAAEGTALQEVQDVIDRHLARFAFRDRPDVEWQAPEGKEKTANAA